MRIPKRFKIMGYDIKVSVDGELREDHQALGRSALARGVIHLSDIGRTFSRECFEQTFCHELTHLILAAMNESELTDNEKFVDMFGGLLHQALVTQKGEIE